MRLRSRCLIFAQILVAYSMVAAGRGLMGAASAAAIHRAAGTAPLGDNATVGQHLHVVSGAFATHREQA